MHWQKKALADLPRVCYLLVRLTGPNGIVWWRAHENKLHATNENSSHSISDALEISTMIASSNYVTGISDILNYSCSLWASLDVVAVDVVGKCKKIQFNWPNEYASIMKNGSVCIKTYSNTHTCAGALSRTLQIEAENNQFASISTFPSAKFYVIRGSAGIEQHTIYDARDCSIFERFPWLVFFFTYHSVCCNNEIRQFEQLLKNE